MANLGINQSINPYICRHLLNGGKIKSKPTKGLSTVERLIRHGLAQ